MKMAYNEIALLFILIVSATSNNQYRFTITQSLLTWEQARHNCLAAGGDLASILSALDQAKIDVLAGSVEYHWIGLNDRAVEGTFVWSDGSAVGFTNWNWAQPDNGGGAEDCAHVNFAIQGNWNDIPCSRKIKSICKIPVAGRRPDPCTLGAHSVDSNWQRSTQHQLGSAALSRSDYSINEGWYRFNSRAGGTIPNTCPLPNSCGTTGPIWAEGSLPTRVGKNFEATLTAYGSTSAGCKTFQWDLYVRKCNENGETFYIYELTKPADRQLSYCAGSEKPCEAGWSSPTGFTPGCTQSYPKISSKPAVSPGQTTVDGKADVQFTCSFDSIDSKSESRYEVKWLTGTPPTELRTATISGSDASREDKITLKILHAHKKFQLGKTLFCRVVSWYSYSVDLKSSISESNHFYAGLLVDQSHIKVKLSEGIQEPIEVTVQSTIPVLRDIGREVILALEEKDDRGNVILSGCEMKFRSGVTKASFKINIMKDKVQKSDYQMHVSLKIKPNDLFNDIWDNHFPLKPIKVMVYEVPFGRCTSVSDPHIVSFDNAYYHLYQVGEYVLVKSSSRKFEVQVRTFQCSTVACNCGLAVREGDDIIIIDMCKNRVPTVVSPSADSGIKPKDGTQIRRDKSGKRFILDFPSGANIKFEMVPWYGDWYYADIEVNVPSDDYKSTRGLCGTFDGDITNELEDHRGKNLRKGQNMNNFVLPKKFIDEWRVQRGSLFQSIQNAKPKCNVERDHPYCTCGNGAKNEIHCNVKSRLANPPQEKQGYTPIKPEEKSVCGRRRKRRSTDEYIVLPEAGGSLDYVFNPEPLNFTAPTWPTKTGKTENTVKAKCTDAIMNSIAKKACQQIDSFDYDIYIGQCIEDVKITDDYEFSSSAVKAMMSACEDVLLSNISYWKADSTGNGTLAPPVEIMEIQCPGLCSGRGKCVNSTCLCDPGFTSDDCSINVTKGITFRSISEEGLCDIRKRSDCLKIKAIGRDFIDSKNLSCRITDVEISKNGVGIKGKVTLARAYLLSFAEVVCEMRTNPVRRSEDPRAGKGIPYAGFKVEVSNDGIRYSKESHLYRIYDSRCIKCDLNGTCVQKNDSCLINGFCFKSGENNSYVPCLRCIPSKNKADFVEVKTGSCKPTTASIPVTTTQPTATTKQRIGTTKQPIETKENTNKTTQTTMKGTQTTMKRTTAAKTSTTDSVTESVSTTLKATQPAQQRTWRPREKSRDDEADIGHHFLIGGSIAGAILLIGFAGFGLYKMKRHVTRSTKMSSVVGINNDEVFELGEVGGTK